MSVDFLEMNEPNFVWKNLNATLDMGCIIETELPEISPNKRYETITVVGRSGELHETFNDYDSYDLSIKDITIPIDRLAAVKKWLRGSSKLITHNDRDKYRDAICMMGKPIEFENEWGFFYKFDVTFRCQPFRKKVNENPKLFAKGSLFFVDHGDEVAKPYIEVDSVGGDFSLKLGDLQLTVINSQRGLVTIDCEMGKIMQEGLPLFSKGEWLRIQPGANELITSGNLSGGKLLNRSVWL